MPRLVAICLRHGRAVVSAAIDTNDTAKGYEPASNWQELEPLALEEVAQASFGGPYVYPCSRALAAQAFFLDQPRPPSGTLQGTLFLAVESEARP